MQGAFDFKFVGDFFDEFFTLPQITIFRPIGKPPHFIPVHDNSTAQDDGNETLRAFPRGSLFPG